MEPWHGILCVLVCNLEILLGSLINIWVDENLPKSKKTPVPKFEAQHKKEETFKST